MKLAVVFLLLSATQAVASPCDDIARLSEKIMQLRQVGATEYEITNVVKDQPVAVQDLVTDIVIEAFRWPLISDKELVSWLFAERTRSFCEDF